MRIHRLLPSDAESWALCSVFEARVRKLGVSLGSSHIDTEVRDMWLRWHQWTQFTGYWIGLAPEPVAHWLSWVTRLYDESYVLVYQVENEMPFDRDARYAFRDQFDSWIRGLNDGALEEKHKIERIEFWTGHSPEVMMRWAKDLGYECQKQRSVINVKVHA